MSFTRKNLMSVLAFALGFVLLFAAADRLLHVKEVYSGTWTRVREEQAVPQMIILGNSHAFCSFVPSIVGDALGLDAAVLGTSGHNSVGASDSFAALLKTGVPAVLVVELNAYTFQYDDTQLYHKSSALSNLNGMPSLASRVAGAFREFGYESIPQGAFQLLRADLMWTRWNGAEPVSSADGSSMLNWHATGVYDAAAAQQQARIIAQNGAISVAVDERNLQQFHRLMKLADANGVKVLLVKTPTAGATQEGRDELNAFADAAGSYGCFLGFYDAHQSVADMELVIEDFYDKGHLSRSGAAKFSRHIAGWLAEKLGREEQMRNVFAYLNETVEPAQDGRWRYEMNALGQDVLFRFELDGETVQDFDRSNAVELSLPPQEADRLTAVMRSGEETITLSFMTQNSCVFR